MTQETKYAICEDCKKPMSPKGCLYSHFEINEKKYERIKSGYTDDFIQNADKDHICHDCNVGIGQYHHFGCSCERCPVCGRQLITCKCFDGADVIFIRHDVGDSIKFI